MKVKKLKAQLGTWVRRAVEVGRNLFRRSKRTLRDAWVKHTQLMRSNPEYRKVFKAAAKKVAAALTAVAAVAAPVLAIPVRAVVVAISLYLAAEGWA